MTKSPGLVLFILTFAVGLKGAETFTNRVTTEEYRESGLGKLSAPERAKLDALIARYYGTDASDTVAVAKADAEHAHQEAQAAREELKRQQEAAEAARKAMIEEKKESSRAEAKAEPTQVQGRLIGTIRGWEEKTIFVLEDGQRWQVANYTRYVARHPVVNPSISITKGMFGYNMDIDGIGTVRVRPLGK